MYTNSSVQLKGTCCSTTAETKLAMHIHRVGLRTQLAGYFK